VNTEIEQLIKFLLRHYARMIYCHRVFVCLSIRLSLSVTTHKPALYQNG